jgi:hypothetical protein
MILLTWKTKILICVLFGFQYLAIPRMLLCDGVIPRKRIFVKKFLEVNGVWRCVLVSHKFPERGCFQLHAHCLFEKKIGPRQFGALSYITYPLKADFKNCKLLLNTPGWLFSREGYL